MAMKKILVAEATETQLDWLCHKLSDNSVQVVVVVRHGTPEMWWETDVFPHRGGDVTATCGGKAVSLSGSPASTYTKPWCEASYTSGWARMGPIIDRMAREGLLIRTWPDHDETQVMVQVGYNSFYNTWECFAHDEESILIAAARCYVASKLGAEVEVPEELS